MSKVKNIILDLDETLISSTELDEFDWDKYEQKIPLFVSERVFDYLTVERPHIQTFLNHIFSNYKVSVWTAASAAYGIEIVETFILTSPERKLDYIFTAEHCELANKLYGGHKDLRLLFDEFKLKGYDRSNTIIIDDHRKVFETQPNNTISVPPFNFSDPGSENDTFFKVSE